MSQHQINIKFPPTSGLNWDDDLKSMEIGDGTNRRNCDYSGGTKGNIGRVDNALGNKLIIGGVLNGGCKIIGSCKDIENNAILYFSKGSATVPDRILRLNLDDESVNIILQGNSLLNFSLTHKIKRNCAIIDGMLYWTDYYNPPRKCNIDKAMKYSNVLPGGYTVMNSDVLERVKYPPAKNPLIEYYSDINFNQNRLRGYLFQFSYQYIYDDNEESVLSPLSIVLIPDGQELFNGDWLEDAIVNNAIKITLNTGPEIVTDLRIYARESNSGEKYLVDKLNKEEMGYGNNADVDYYFYNNRQRIGVDKDVVDRLFDYMPRLSGAMEFTSDNRIVDGDILEGFDKTNIDMRLVYRYDNIFYNDLVVFIWPAIYWFPPGVPLRPSDGLSCFVFTFLLDTLIPYLQSGYIMAFNLSYYILADDTTYTGDFILPITDAHVADISTLVDDFHIALVHSGLAGSVNDPSQDIQEYGGVSNSVYLYTNAPSNVGELTNIVSNTRIIKNVNPTPSYKDGHSHTFGIVYYDKALRNGATNKKHNEDTIDIPFITELSLDSQYTDRLYKKFSIISEINNIPPIWAYYYNIVYMKNTPEFFQFHIAVPTDSADYTGKIEIDMASRITNEITKNPKLTYSTWIWQKGDRIRFIYNQSFPNLTGNIQWIDGLIDKEIIGQDPTNSKFILDKFDWALFDIHYYTVAEVYRPRKEFPEDSEIYYEFGKNFDIIDAGTINRRHQGDTDQNITGTPLTYPIWFMHNNIPGILVIYFYASNITPPANSYIKFLYKIGDSITINTPSSYAGTYNIISNNPSSGEIQCAYSGADYGGLFNGSANMPTNGAILNLDRGDVYVKNRYTISHLFPCMDDSISDWYSSKMTDIGRINIVIEDMRELRLQNLRYSDPIIQNTKINGLSTVYGSYYVSIPEKFGIIRNLRQVGDALKVRQDKKNHSIYIGKVSPKNPDGTDDIILSDTVLGTMMTPHVSYGTVHPESELLHERHAYFFDVGTMAYIRDSANGMFEISSYKMVSFFKEWSDKIQNARVSEVISGYNQYFNQLIVTMIADDESVTIAFSEDGNRWKAFFDYIPEWMEFIGTKFVSFKDGHPYLHNSSSVPRMNYYGVQNDCVVDINVYGNGKGLIFKNLALYTNNNKPNTANPERSWEMSSMIVPPSLHFPTGMLSRLKYNKFERKQGVLYAAILSDINTPGASSTVDGLINGRDMKGEVATLTLKHTNSDLVSLDRVVVGVNLDELSF